ncbi:DnaJ domain-containing protein [Mycoplasma sp. ES3225-GEN-MYC]|uniref:DnaJ C-terminal domain-containing protein n=1 Tax=Mycoplasma miroungigenitalium TaxID=754515 RepID=UPI001C0F6F20|nr:DnaJ C-terminal domain-containing protein [Mycoplasma miroungigenitalium]MBU4691628.1 DnaJ domain-containing protein [Mycoplasma miroungigenitalium]
MSKKDYYEVLGVSKDASEKEIKHAYRKLAMQYHPDKLKDGTSDKKMQELNEAYEVLSDKQKRENYDKYGSEEGPQGFGDFGGFSGFGDIFSNFFNGFAGYGRNSFEPSRGNDMLMRLQITFNESIKGKEVKQNLDKWEVCSHCNGRGGATPADIVTCDSCHGSGQQQIQQRTPFGIINNTSVCNKCKGKGEQIINKCKVCSGKIYIKKEKVVTFSVPAGSDNGDRIKLTGYGGRGENGGSSGDLYVEINVQPHQYFQRDNLNIYLEYPVSFIDIIKENEVLVPTPYGTETIKLRRTYQNGKTLVLSGKGVRKSNRAGDLKILLKVIIPELSSSDMKKLSKDLEQYSDTTNTDFIKQFK